MLGNIYLRWLLWGIRLLLVAFRFLSGKKSILMSDHYFNINIKNIMNHVDTSSWWGASMLTSSFLGTHPSPITNLLMLNVKISGKVANLVLLIINNLKWFIIFRQVESILLSSNARLRGRAKESWDCLGASEFLDALLKWYLRPVSLFSCFTLRHKHN